jgi:hypothetical protein
MPENKKGRKMSPVKAGLAGTAIVAAGVAAVALSKKDNRRKAGKALKDLSVKGKKLTMQAANGIDKIMKSEELLHNKAQSALSRVKKASTKVSKGKIVKTVAKKVAKPKSVAKKSKNTAK